MCVCVCHRHGKGFGKDMTRFRLSVLFGIFGMELADTQINYCSSAHAQ